MVRTRPLYIRSCSKRGFSPPYQTEKGGLNSKLHAVYDDQGRSVRLHLTAEQVSNFKGADVLLANLTGEAEEIINNHGYDTTCLITR